MSEKSGILQGNFKSSVRPQDDMYRHVKGGWLDKADHSAFGVKEGDSLYMPNSEQVAIW